MKQLIDTFHGDNGDEYFIVALDDRALVGSTTSSSSTLLELEKPCTNNDTSPRTGQTESEDPSSKDDNEIPLEQIQAVAGCRCKDHDALYLAVARHSKELCIYRVTLAQLLQLSGTATTVTTIPPLTLHQTPKRVSSMVFGEIPSLLSSSSSSSLTVLVTGDLAGDAFAYSLTQASTQITAKEAANEASLPHRRLLLGHTASMLTSVAFCTLQNDSSARYILTADRDEKIRVTNFPSTFEIHGFLFGHTAFVSCMAVSGARCFSCGGDAKLRVWNVQTCQEQARLDLQNDLTKFQVASGVPCEMCVGQDGTSQQPVVAVIYDRSSNLDLFSIESSDSSKDVWITERRQIILPRQPIGLASCGSKFLVLLQEPIYIQCYDWNGQVCDLPEAVLQSTELARREKVKLPNGILERDPQGNLKMSKNLETRGPAGLMPWNNAERKQVAVDKRRRKKRRKKNKQATSDDDAVDDDKNVFENSEGGEEAKD